MVTTKQVRAVIAMFPDTVRRGVYTNKTKGAVTLDRRVKCYYQNNSALVVALQKLAGRHNVKITKGSNFCRRQPGAIIVKCQLG